MFRLLATFLIAAIPSLAAAQSETPVPLAEGEVILETFTTSPSIIRVPEAAPAPVYAAPAYTETYRVDTEAGIGERTRSERVEPTQGVLAAPARLGEPMRDRVGWTGRKGLPAAVGCFPRGACAELNGF